ncbi:colicin immunity domain-containing protein [Cedecea neteri]|uniref:colicin immunity domain-containing protein n=1 Tax=Cedecea neteri TaxID=158822 RepID=UPI002AA8EFE9|nr:colicin immunity domain-containing protein [Cedecea neteri]WPU24779.1 colicin immunity domain-containing protein [Cedecea neteri]
MSLIILEFVRSFVDERITPQVFAEAYIELYRIERDNNFLLKEETGVSECLSSIFCLADLYNPDADKEEYELDDKKLLELVAEELKKLG